MALCEDHVFQLIRTVVAFYRNRDTVPRAGGTDPRVPHFGAPAPSTPYFYSKPICASRKSLRTWLLIFKLILSYIFMTLSWGKFNSKPFMSGLSISNGCYWWKFYGRWLNRCSKFFKCCLNFYAKIRLLKDKTKNRKSRCMKQCS